MKVAWIVTGNSSLPRQQLETRLGLTFFDQGKVLDRDSWQWACVHLVWEEKIEHQEVGFQPNGLGESAVG